MSNLKKICEEIITASEPAIVTPYDDGLMFGIFRGFDGDRKTRQYLQISANHAHKLARALLVMEEVLKDAKEELMRISYDEPRHVKEMAERCEEALAQAEEILK